MAEKRDIARILLDMKYLANSPMNGDNTADITENYAADLSDIPAELLEAAARHYKSTERFFPQSGALREKALALMVDAMRIPTALEAWGYIQSSTRYIPAVDCQAGHELRKAVDGRIGGEYWMAVRAHEKHVKECGICTAGKTIDDYRHPAVESVVNALGGKERIFTDNPTADRARFIEAYDEIIKREKNHAIMHADVKRFVDNARLAIEDNQRGTFAIQNIRQLTEGMTK